MSLVPCDRHGTTVVGRVVGTYPTVVFDGARYSRRLRLCDACLEQLLDAHVSDWDDVSVAQHGRIDGHCYKCDTNGLSPKDLQTFWFTAYVKGKYRRDYRAWYCRSCAQTMIDTLELEAPHE